jgi:hypothetical protein
VKKLIYSLSSKQKDGFDYFLWHAVERAQEQLNILNLADNESRQCGIIDMFEPPRRAPQTHHWETL